MSLTCAQLITLACQQAGVPGFTSQAGQKLNTILQELAQSYSFSSAQGWWTGTFNSGIGGTVNSANVVAGSGPYQLPSDFLRLDFHDFFFQSGGINYFPVPRDMNEYDATPQQTGFSSYPTDFAVDTSTSPAGLYVWPAPSGAFPFFARYRKQQADVTSPETSTSVPWFPSQMYLDRRLTAEVMLIAGDDRFKAFMDDAEAILNRYMKLEGNNSNRAQRVQLDPRSFGPKWSTLPNSKTIPW